MNIDGVENTKIKFFSRTKYKENSSRLVEKHDFTFLSIQNLGTNKNELVIQIKNILIISDNWPRAAHFYESDLYIHGPHH